MENFKWTKSGLIYRARHFPTRNVERKSIGKKMSRDSGTCMKIINYLLTALQEWEFTRPFHKFCSVKTAFMTLLALSTPIHSWVYSEVSQGWMMCYSLTDWCKIGCENLALFYLLSRNNTPKNYEVMPFFLLGYLKYGFFSLIKSMLFMLTCNGFFLLFLLFSSSLLWFLFFFCF